MKGKVPSQQIRNQMQRCAIPRLEEKSDVTWKLIYFDTTEQIALSTIQIISRPYRVIFRNKSKPHTHCFVSVLSLFFSSLLNVQECLVLSEPLKDFKIVRKCLPGATRILDGYWNVSTSSKRECHCHSMVIICVYRCYIQFLGRSNHTVIRTFFNRCS